MKITCDLCGGMLQINPGGQGATCTTCGLGYTMERLREKLSALGGQQNSPKTVIPKPELPNKETPTPVISQPNPTNAEMPIPAIPQQNSTNATAAASENPKQDPTQTGVTKTDIPEPESTKAEFSKADTPEPEFPKTEITAPVIPDIELQESGLPEPEPFSQEPDDVILCDIPEFAKENPPKRSFDFVPKQFVMDITGGGYADLSGRVQQGGIGLGDCIYIDGDYSTPYRICGINNNPANTCVKAGMKAELTIEVPPFKRRKLKKVNTVIGDRNPVASAYNYPGTVQEYFTDLLSAEFSQYDIRTNITHDALDISVNFMFYRNSMPVLAVFLSNSNARSKTEKACRDLETVGIASVRFFENYRNDAPYVIDRIKGALG